LCSGAIFPVRLAKRQGGSAKTVPNCCSLTNSSVTADIGFFIDTSDGKMRQYNSVAERKTNRAINPAEPNGCAMS